MELRLGCWRAGLLGRDRGRLLGSRGSRRIGLRAGCKRGVGCLLARRASGFLFLVSSIRLYMEKRDDCVYLVQTCLKLCEDVRHGKRWWAAEVWSEEGGVPWLVAEDGWELFH